MPHATKYILTILVFLIMVVGVISLKKDAKDPMRARTISIGAILPLSGDAVLYGESARNVMDIATEHINAQGGVNGHALEMIYEDGKCDEKDAATAMQKLITVDNVQLVIGGLCESESLGAVPIANANHVLLFSPAQSLLNVSTDGGNPVFRNSPNMVSKGMTLAQFATIKGWNNVAIIQEESESLHGLGTAFATTFIANGGEIVFHPYVDEPDTLRERLSMLKSSGVDALFLNVSHSGVSERILQSTKDLQWKPALLGSDIKIVSETSELFEGMVIAELAFDPNNKSFIDLSQAYKAKFSSELPFPDSARTEYDAVFILVDALKAVGLDSQMIIGWLLKVKDWEGSSGITNFDENGNRIGGYAIKIIHDGAVVPRE
ncbi:MAG TPA: ABC transporter substrate-binding protein [Patescibacteria group bacterium]|nr:ABC transporter substrate-binding protein [Patescibacteria group bacterium]